MNIIIGAIIAPSLVAFSGVWYIWNTCAGINKPNLVSWAIWALIGWALFLVTQDNPRADTMTKIFAFILALSPTLVAVVALEKGAIERVGVMEVISAIIALVALGTWWQMKDNQGVLPVMIAIIADACALIPTLRFVFRTPQEDRPMPWLAFSTGSLLTLVSIEQWNAESWLLPTYMMFGSFAVFVPLAWYRWKRQVPWREWV